MSVVSAIFALDTLLEHSSQELFAKLALGRLGVGVNDEGMRNLEPVGHHDLDFRRTASDHRSRALFFGCAGAHTSIPVGWHQKDPVCTGPEGGARGQRRVGARHRRERATPFFLVTAIVGNLEDAPLVVIEAASFTFQALLEQSHEKLAAKVAKGRHLVGVN